MISSSDSPYTSASDLLPNGSSDATFLLFLGGSTVAGLSVVSSLLEKKFDAVNWELKGIAGSSGLGGVGSPKVFVQSLRGVWDILDGIKSGYSVKRVCTASRLAPGASSRWYERRIQWIVSITNPSTHVMIHPDPSTDRPVQVRPYKEDQSKPSHPE